MNIWIFFYIFRKFAGTIVLMSPNGYVCVHERARGERQRHTEWRGDGMARGHCVLFYHCLLYALETRSPHWARSLAGCLQMPLVLPSSPSTALRLQVPVWPCLAILSVSGSQACTPGTLAHWAISPAPSVICSEEAFDRSSGPISSVVDVIMI